jgi:ABC-type transport system substrate-binding protein
MVANAMKKSRLIFNSASRSTLVAVLLLLVSMVACKKDSDPAPSTGVEGSWQITAITVSPAQNGITDLVPFINAFAGNDCFLRLTLVFKNNGSIGVTAPNDCQNSKATLQDLSGIDESTTWKVDKDKLTLTNGSNVEDYTLQVDQSTMNLAYSEVSSSDGKTYTYTIKLKRV